MVRLRFRRPGMAPASRSERRIALVGKQVTHATSTFEKRGRCLHIADIAGRQHQVVGTTDDIGERMDLGRPATARSTDRLDLARPFPPKAARCVLM